MVEIEGARRRRGTRAAMLVLTLALLTACAIPRDRGAGDGGVSGSVGGGSSAGSLAGGSSSDDGGRAGGDAGGDAGGAQEQQSVAVRGVTVNPVSYTASCNGAPAAVTFTAEIAGTPGTAVGYRWVDGDGRRGTPQTVRLPSATDGTQTSAKVTSTWARPPGGWPARYRGSRTVEITGPVTVASAAPASFTIDCKAAGAVDVVIEKISLKRLTPGGLCQMEVVVNDRSPAPVDIAMLRADGTARVVAASNDTYPLQFDNGWWPAASAKGTYRATFPLAQGYPVVYQVSIKHGGVVVAGRSSSGGQMCG